MDFKTAFTLWRPFGVTGRGWITLAALTAIHMTHRLLAAVALAALGWLAWRLRKVPGAGVTALGCGGLVLWQVVTGLSNVVPDWPLASALGHTLGAALMVWRLTRLIVRPRYQGIPLPPWDEATFRMNSAQDFDDEVPQGMPMAQTVASPPLSRPGRHRVFSSSMC